MNRHNGYKLEELQKLVGGMICCTLDEEDDTNMPNAIGFLVMMPNKTEHQVWIESDDEGNGPGSVYIRSTERGNGELKQSLKKKKQSLGLNKGTTMDKAFQKYHAH